MTARTRRTTLLYLVLALGAASLLHFAHNALWLHDYPNLPRWLTATGVVEAWLGVTGIGALGFLIYCRGAQIAGLSIIALYAALGFAGLDHYTVAAVSAHTLMMNLTIVLEAAAAGVLLCFVALCLLQPAMPPAR